MLEALEEEVKKPSKLHHLVAGRFGATKGARLKAHARVPGSEEKVWRAGAGAKRRLLESSSGFPETAGRAHFQQLVPVDSAEAYEHAAAAYARAGRSPRALLGKPEWLLHPEHRQGSG